MATYSISRNGAGVTSKILVTDLPDDVVTSALERARISGARKGDSGWHIRANRREEGVLDAVLRVECKRAVIEAARAVAAAQSENVVQLRPAAGNRKVVEAGTVKVGDILAGRVVTGLGQSWRANADSAAQHGVGPWAEKIQYAYFD